MKNLNHVLKTMIGGNKVGVLIFLACIWPAHASSVNHISELNDRIFTARWTNAFSSFIDDWKERQPDDPLLSLLDNGYM